MATAIPLVAAPLVTIGDIMAALPDVPLERIRLVPTPGTATEEDVLRARDEPKRMLCELVDGVLVEKDMGFVESVIVLNLLTELHRFVRQHDLGVVAGEAGMLRLAANLVRIPDGTFISWDQMPGRVFPVEQVWGLYPDLAIEVLSPSNTKIEMARKIKDYFAAGTRLIWIVDPRTETVAVHAAPHSPEECRTFARGERLSGEDVLPGFELDVAAIFDV